MYNVGRIPCYFGREIHTWLLIISNRHITKSYKCKIRRNKRGSAADLRRMDVRGTQAHTWTIISNSRRYENTVSPTLKYFHFTKMHIKSIRQILEKRWSVAAIVAYIWSRSRRNVSQIFPSKITIKMSALHDRWLVFVNIAMEAFTHSCASRICSEHL